MYRRFLQNMEKTEICPGGLENLLKVGLESEKNNPSSFLSKEDISILLEKPCDPPPSDACPRKGLVGYPSYPLYKEISKVIYEWIETGKCPLHNLKSYYLLDEASYVEERNCQMMSVNPLLEGLKALWGDWNNEEKQSRLLLILKRIGRRGLLDLLGLRKTAGTVDVFPPDRQVLLNTFTMKHSPKAQLSVGARALAKHCHRDESSSWWGKSQGSEALKNEHALKTVMRIMNEATWINIHTLPHDVHVIEMRQEDGYGARWSADGSMFRGFLEPQMADGHEVGWRH